jgi:hypothetical protein
MMMMMLRAFNDGASLDKNMLGSMYESKFLWPEPNRTELGLVLRALFTSSSFGIKCNRNNINKFLSRIFFPGFQSLPESVM